MPLFWVSSMFMVFMLLIVLILLYNFKEFEMYNIKMIDFKKVNYLIGW